MANLSPSPITSNVESKGANPKVATLNRYNFFVAGMVFASETSQSPDHVLSIKLSMVNMSDIYTIGVLWRYFPSDFTTIGDIDLIVYVSIWVLKLPRSEMRFIENINKLILFSFIGQ